MHLKVLLFGLGLVLLSGAPVFAASLQDLDHNQNGRIDVYDFANALSRLQQDRSLTDLATIKEQFDVAIAQPSTTPEPSPTLGSKKTKKWHPGHYIYHKDGNVDPQRIKDYYKDARYDATAGVYVQIYWKSLEPQKDQYNFQFIQQYLDALPENKHLFFVFMDRDYQSTSCASSRLPGWVDKVHGEESADGKKDCIAKFWEPAVMNQEIELFSEIAKRFDAHPQFEGILLQETSFGASLVGISHEQAYAAYFQIHERSKDFFKQSHLFRNMNSLGGPTKSCQLLGQLADGLRSYGYGIANPDSVAWDAMPWNCIGSNKIGENNNDASKPVYAIYRQLGNSLPKLIGNDGSQLGNPNSPRMFNGERMTIPNLVKYHYLTAVKGFTHKDYGEIKPFGANYLMWLSDFWSDETKGITPKMKKEMKKEWTDEVLKFINEPGHETNQTCPSNITCQP